MSLQQEYCLQSGIFETLWVLAYIYAVEYISPWQPSVMLIGTPFGHHASITLAQGKLQVSQFL
jgi:hypothetical protein